MSGSDPTFWRLAFAVAAAFSIAAGGGCAAAPPAPRSGASAREAAARPAAPVSAGSTSARPTPAPAPAAARAKASPALLVGIWRPVGAADGAGRDAVPGGDLVLEFRADGTWYIAGASYRARGAYRWVGAEEIELTTVDSNLPPQVGTRSRRRVAVDASELALTAPPPDLGGRRAAEAAAVTTAYRRAGGR